MSEAKSLFYRKGFSAPKVVELGDWRLLQYKKIFLDTEDFVVKNNRALFACGTIVYQGLRYRDYWYVSMRYGERRLVS